MSENNKKPLVILTGPTGVGKTELSIKLAKKINGAVISADSIQVYRHMDIGSAKIMPQEMDGVKHYLIDIINPDEEFNVFVFQKLAKNAMDEIYNQGKIPIITGGTGFYIQSVLYDIDFNEEALIEEINIAIKHNGKNYKPYLIMSKSTLLEFENFNDEQVYIEHRSEEDLWTADYILNDTNYRIVIDNDLDFGVVKVR